MNTLAHRSSPTDDLHGAIVWPAAIAGWERAFAHFLHQRQPTTQAAHLWLAALVVHQWARGHACLDVHALQATPSLLGHWSAAERRLLPVHKLAHAMNSLPWSQGPHSPLVQHQDRLYLRRNWQAEVSIRSCLAARLASPNTPVEAAQLADWLTQLFGPADAAAPQHSQRSACLHAAEQNLCLITGGPGTGKTTTVAKLLALWQQGQATNPLRVVLTAPTGKAAARLTQAWHQALLKLPSHWPQPRAAQAQTLHRLLLAAERDQAHIDADVVVVDEASMVDVELMARLLQRVPTTVRLLLLGDPDQLASVQAGAVLAQLCDNPSLQAHTHQLSHSHRFGNQSAIGQWANAVRQAHTGQLKALWDSAVASPLSGVSVWLPGSALPSGGRASSSTSQAHWPSLWADWLASTAHLSQLPHGCDDAGALANLAAFAQLGVLCALREGPWGVQALNQRLAHSLGLGRSEWYAGRPVMVTRNSASLDLMNGDVGMCLPRSVAGQRVLRVAFADGQGGVRWLAPARLDAVDTVFAMTVHKSQGSEFDHVVLVLPDHDSPVLTRELIYTGITRARQRLSLWVPQPQVLWDACVRHVQRSGGLQQNLGSISLDAP